MRNRLLLLVSVIALYLISAYALHLIYGPSYPFLAGEDCWMPDNSGGWIAHGSPSDPMPAVASEEIPLALIYLPIFLPGLLLALFLLTPLRHRLEPRPVAKEDASTSDDDNDA